MSELTQPLKRHGGEKFLAKAMKWNLTEIVIDNKSSSAKVKEKKVECVWYNY